MLSLFTIKPKESKPDTPKIMMEKYPRSRVFLDIFDGGHEIDMETAMYWLMSQYEATDKKQITG